MKNKRSKIASLFKIGVLFLGISLLLWNCNKDESQIINPQIEKAQNWFNKNHNTLLEENTFFIGNINWDSAEVINKSIYIPIEKNIPVQINSNNGETKFIFPYILLEEKENGSYTEELKVLFQIG